MLCDGIWLGKQLLHRSIQWVNVPLFLQAEKAERDIADVAATDSQPQTKKKSLLGGLCTQLDLWCLNVFKYCKTLNVSIPFIARISRAKQNRKIKGH